MTCLRTWIKKKLLNKMENKELEEKSLPTEQVTTTEKKTKPKDPGRIAAGKKLAEYNKKAREAKKSGREKEIPKENKDEIPKENNQEGSFSLTQILSVVSIVVSLAGLYYKRKELMSFVKTEKNDFRAPPIREMNSERRERRGQIKISEEDLERLREEKQKMEEYLKEPKKDSKLKPMD